MRYEIKGDTLPVVICHLEAGERMITERGSMAWMSPNMKMETTSNGGIILPNIFCKVPSILRILFFYNIFQSLIFFFLAHLQFRKYDLRLEQVCFCCNI